MFTGRVQLNKRKKGGIHHYSVASMYVVIYTDALWYPFNKSLDVVRPRPGWPNSW